MAEYCLVPNLVFAYICVCISCLCCAVIQLFTQFRSTNKVFYILWGWPQTFLYLSYVIASLLIFFISEVKGYTHITNGENSAFMVVESLIMGAVIFFALKFNVKTEKIEFGPGVLYKALLDNVEARIDDKRMMGMSSDIKKISKIPSPRMILNVVLPYCFNMTEKVISKDSMQDTTRVCEAIFSSKDPISNDEKAKLMLVKLNQNFGIKAITDAIEVFKNEQGGFDEKFDTDYQNKLQSQDSGLDISKITAWIQKNNKG